LNRILITGAALWLLAGCGPSDAQTGKAQGQATAGTAATASGEALCKLFTTQEIAAYIGPVTGTSTGSAATAGIADLATCIWKTADYRSTLTLTVQDVSDNPHASQLPLKKGQDFRLVPELGEDGFAQMTGGSAMAGAKRGRAFVSVLIRAPKADTGQAIRLLQEVIKRRG
jgi:hypothetical protein